MSELEKEFYSCLFTNQKEPGNAEIFAMVRILSIRV